MKQIQIPATRSQFSTFVELTSTQYWILRSDLEFTDAELGTCSGHAVLVNADLLARIQRAAEIFRAEGNASTVKRMVKRTVTILTNEFEAKFNSVVAAFQRELEAARKELAAGASIDSWELVWKARSGDRIEVIYSTFEGDTSFQWERTQTNCETIRSEFVLDEDGEPTMKFVVCEGGYLSVRDSDPRFETLAEAKAHARLLIDWTAAQCYELRVKHIAELAAEVARVDMMLELLAAAGVEVLAAA